MVTVRSALSSLSAAPCPPRDAPAGWRQCPPDMYFSKSLARQHANITAIGTKVSESKPASGGNLTRALVHEQQKANRPMIHAKLLAFQKANVVIHKDASANVGGGRSYRYATLPNVLDAIRPALNAAGLVLTQVMDGGELVTRLVDCDTGEHIESRFPMSFEGLNWHAIGSAQTYARRYSVLGLLGLAPDDDDDAISTLPVKTTSQPQRGDGGPVVAAKRCNHCDSIMEVGPNTGQLFCRDCFKAKRNGYSQPLATGERNN